MQRKEHYYVNLNGKGDQMKYKLNKITLVPDKYGYHLKIGMITKLDNNGKYIKHVKINEDIVNILKNNFVIEE